MESKINPVVKITTSCPANCICCTNRKEKMRASGEANKTFSLTAFENVCKAVKSLGASYVCLSGGEPTIVHNINEYFNVANRHGLRTRINTNGWGISENNVKEWLSLGLEQIVLSVYSLNADTLKKIRGNDRLLQASNRAANILREMKNSHNFRFIIQTVIMKENYEELPDLLEYSIINHADRFWPSYLEDAVNLPTARLNAQDIYAFRTNIIPKMKEVVQRYRLTHHNATMLSAIDTYYSRDYDGYAYHDDDYCCDWLGKHLTFYPNGMVYPCPGHEYFRSSHEYNINYSEIRDGLVTILNSPCKSLGVYCRYCPQGEHQEIILSKETVRKEGRANQ